MTESFEEFLKKESGSYTTWRIKLPADRDAEQLISVKGLGEWAWKALLKKCGGIEGIKDIEKTEGIFGFDIFDEGSNMEVLLGEIAITNLGENEIKKRLKELK